MATKTLKTARWANQQHQVAAGRYQELGVVSLLSDQAYELIKRDIVQCRLTPGAEISETALTKMYGFGKAPIRVALLRLSQDNLVSSMPRRGYTVTPITIRNVQELYELRIILEPAAARRATSRCDIPELMALCKRLRYSDGVNNTSEYLEAHFAFHVAIAKAAGNERITHLIESLLNDMARIIHFGEFAPGRRLEQLDADHRLQEKQHEAIVESLAAGDADVVEKVMRDHIEHSLMMVKEAAFASKSLVRI
jgi:DNA-binding GntR family transcriptional regulator